MLLSLPAEVCNKKPILPMRVSLALLFMFTATWVIILLANHTTVDNFNFIYATSHFFFGVVLIVGNIYVLMIKKGYGKTSATVTMRTIQFHTPLFDALGKIHWRDVISVTETTRGAKGGRFYFFVKEPDIYINNIQSSFKRKVLKSVSRSHNNALFFINSQNLNYNSDTLKETFSHLINSNK
jgi:hypothetical protein